MNIFDNAVMVTRKQGLGNLIARYLCLVLAVVCLLVSIVIIPGILLAPAIILFAVWYWMKQSSLIEYEYTYIEGELAIDRIKAKRKRKKIAKIDMDAVMMIAPIGSDELRDYENNKNMVVKDCSSRMQGRKLYEVVYRKDSDLLGIIFEPDDNMLTIIQSRNPRKVVK